MDNKRKDILTDKLNTSLFEKSPQKTNSKSPINSIVEVENLISGNDKNTQLKLGILIQNKIMKNYSQAINILLSLINNKNNDNIHVDIGTPIQKYLESIKLMEKENFEIKERYLEEVNKGISLNQKLIKIQTETKSMKDDYINENIQNIETEKNTLDENIQCFANELDEQSERCKNIQKYIYKDKYGEYASIEKNMNELNTLTQRNLNLKQILEIQQKQKCMNTYNKKSNDYITLMDVGNYQLEQEEAFEKKKGFISC